MYSFKCYNPKKIEKYHIKSYKVVDSTNNYCLVFDLYVGNINPNEAPSQYGKVYDLVFRLCEPYLGKSYYIHMDNWYSSAANRSSRYCKREPYRLTNWFFQDKTEAEGRTEDIYERQINASNPYI